MREQHLCRHDMRLAAARLVGSSGALGDVCLLQPQTCPTVGARVPKLWFARAPGVGRTLDTRLVARLAGLASGDMLPGTRRPQTPMMFRNS